MKKIIIGLMTALLFLGCSSKDSQEQVEPKLVIGKNLVTLALHDQFEKPQVLKTHTKKIVFAFSKDVAHTCNDYFVTKPKKYLGDNHTLFVADVSAAPSIIRSFFILPGLKEFKHTVLLLDDETVAAPYRAGVDTEKIVVIYLNDRSITDIKTINSIDELKEIIEI